MESKKDKIIFIFFLHLLFYIFAIYLYIFNENNGSNIFKDENMKNIKNV